MASKGNSRAHSECYFAIRQGIALQIASYAHDLEGHVLAGTRDGGMQQHSSRAKIEALQPSHSTRSAGTSWGPALAHHRRRQVCPSGLDLRPRDTYLRVYNMASLHTRIPSRPSHDFILVSNAPFSSRLRSSGEPDFNTSKGAIQGRFPPHSGQGTGQAGERPSPVCRARCA